ncbi:MAG: SEC-C metal-binding domain-containing protein [Bryobacteraceae bacterium]
MLIAPDQYTQTPAYDLLTQAARGRIAFDHRLVHALLDEPARTLPDILRFALEENRPDRVDIDEDLMILFAAAPTPDALPFLVRWLRENPGEEPDDAAVEYIARIGEPAVGPLTSLPHDPEVGFLLAVTGVRDERVRQYIRAIAEKDSDEGAFLFELLRDPETVADVERLRPLAPEAADKALAAIREGAFAPEPLTPFDPFPLFPETIYPDLRLLPPEEREEFLASTSPQLRMVALRLWIDEDLTQAQPQRLLSIARNDPDDQVRATAWDALRSQLEHRSVVTAMEKRLADPGVTHFERASLAVALAEVDCTKSVRDAIQASYASPDTRGRALEAMWRSFDPEYAGTLLSHLEDEDIDCQAAAINAVGVFRLSDAAAKLVPMFENPDLRWDALYSYTVAVPFKAKDGNYDALYEKIQDLAGGFDEDDHRIVESAIEMRAEADAKSPAPAPAAAPKAGRNDPCPCGSGKKFKKCCGA